MKSDYYSDEKRSAILAVFESASASNQNCFALCQAVNSFFGAINAPDLIYSLYGRTNIAGSASLLATVMRLSDPRVRNSSFSSVSDVPSICPVGLPLISSYVALFTLMFDVNVNPAVDGFYEDYFVSTPLAMFSLEDDETGPYVLTS